jgi:BioD-like phosphotransacetylase family protein
VPEETYQATFRVHDLLAKITPEDKKKIRSAKRLVQECVDVDYLLERLK